MSKPHKHAELIKAWADGAEIEFKTYGGWRKCNPMDWAEQMEFRIKPEPKPDYIHKTRIVLFKNYASVRIEFDVGSANLKLTFDGETGQLKSAEVL